jgi:hypothetical protein
VAYPELLQVPVHTIFAKVRFSESVETRSSTVARRRSCYAGWLFRSWSRLQHGSVSLFSTPQADGDEPELVADANSETLVRSWVNHNQRATLATIQQPDFPNPLRMSTSASLYLWRYRQVKEDLFVPNLVPVQRKRRFKTWPGYYIHSGPSDDCAGKLMGFHCGNQKWILPRKKEAGSRRNKRRIVSRTTP